ncbi:MAG: type II secretion system F family protein [Desulfurococcales archaeon]|nr:type II secretion system F family protein [Desulfurococcales archaeon]
MSAKDILKNPVVWVSVFCALMYFFLSFPYNILALTAAPVPLLIYFTINVLRKKGVVTVVDEDLVFLITHMYAVSTGKPPNEKLFMLRGISGVTYREYGEVLHRIAVLAREWSYGFIKSIRIQAQRVANHVFKDFLIRLSEALNVGEDIERFLNAEHEAVLTEYEASYTRVLEAVKTLLGIYTASASSAIFIVVNMTLIALLLFGGVHLILASFIGTIVALAVLVFMMQRSLPKERLVHDLKINLPERRLYVYTLIIAVAFGALIGVFMFRLFNEPAYFMMTFGMMVLVPGLIGRRIENKVMRMDTFFTVFIRSFGLTYMNVRNYTLALGSLLRTDFGELTRPLKRLYARLTSGVDKKISWLYFIGETGSEAIRRGVDIFYDSTEAGGDAAKVGTAVSNLLQHIINLRKRREQVAKAFEATMYVLHTLIVAITEFIMSLVLMFQEVFSKMGTSLPIQVFNIAPVPPELIIMMKFGLIFAVTLLNAFAMKIASGGYSGSVWVNASILLVLSGVTMIVSSKLVGTITQVFTVSLNQTATIP